MKITALLLVAVISITLVCCELVEVSSSSSCPTASSPEFLRRRDSAVNISDVYSTDNKQAGSEPDTVQVAGTDWDPTNIADDATWQKYKKKGNWLRCLMEMPDEVAGRQWPNYLNRNPPSARSEWQGTLEGKSYQSYLYLQQAINNDLHYR
jgi:hypothetical protein